MSSQLGPSLAAAIVARRFYVLGQQKSEIANDLGISRFKVSRLIDEAKASGIVQIKVHMPTELDLALGERVTKRFGIKQAIVVRVIDSSADSVMALIAASGANYISNLVTATDVVGISWGKTLDATFSEISEIAPAEVVQLVGGLANDDIEVGGVELARKLSRKTGGKVFPLHAPMLVGSEALAKQLRVEGSIKPTIDRFQEVSIGIVGVGAWSPKHSSIYFALSENERKSLAEFGVVGDICGTFFSKNGKIALTDARERTMAITAEDIDRIPEIIAIAGGSEKVEALTGALRTGLIDTLITDSKTATHMLENER